MAGLNIRRSIQAAFFTDFPMRFLSAGSSQMSACISSSQLVQVISHCYGKAQAMKFTMQSTIWLSIPDFALLPNYIYTQGIWNVQLSKDVI